MWYVWAEKMGSAQVYTVYARTKPPRPSEWRKPLISTYATKAEAVRVALDLAESMAQRQCPVQVNIQGKEK
jgi:hypothetical protein